ncbi:MAG: glycerate dehydrogenase, partial [Pseudomonas sp.]
MTSHSRAVFLDHASLDLGDLDLAPLHAAFSELTLHAGSTPQQTAERLQHATVAITNKAPINAATFAACPQLKLVLVAATGTNNVDLAAAREQGVV